jgi:hypothetical protein
MSASDDPPTSKEQAGPGTPEDRDAPKPNAMQASYLEALDQRAIARESKAHASLQAAIKGAASPLCLVGTPAAWRKILFKPWSAAQALRRWSDDPCPSLPEEAELPNRPAAEKALESLWDWAQRTLARLPGSPPAESKATPGQASVTRHEDASMSDKKGRAVQPYTHVGFTHTGPPDIINFLADCHALACNGPRVNLRGHYPPDTPSPCSVSPGALNFLARCFELIRDKIAPHVKPQGNSVADRIAGKLLAFGIA